MSYTFQAWLHDDDALTLDDIVEHLADSPPERVHLESGRDYLTVREANWTLRGDHNDHETVAEEAEEMVRSQFAEPLDDDQRAIVLHASSRLEFHPMPEDQSDHHYNAWLMTWEALAELPGVLIFHSFEGTFEG